MHAPTPLLVLNAIVAGGVTIVVLYTLAVFVRCSVELHQLKVQTHRLRINYLERVAALRAGPQDAEEAEVVGVDIVGETAPDASAGTEVQEAAPPAQTPEPLQNAA